MSRRASSALTLCFACAMVFSLSTAEAKRRDKTITPFQSTASRLVTRSPASRVVVRPVTARIGFKMNMGLPSSGFYRQSTPPGSLMMWNTFHYQEVRPGVYLIRSAVGGRPNAFDHGTIVTEFDMYKKLVESGAIRP
jgi:hypothetical protein